jgi:hypothetical protein
VSSQEAIKLCKKKKAELSDPPYVPPEEVCNMRSKKKSNRSGKISAEEMGNKDGVVGAVDDADHEHGEVVSHLLTSSILYHSYVVLTHLLYEFIQKQFNRFWQRVSQYAGQRGWCG